MARKLSPEELENLAENFYEGVSDDEEPFQDSGSEYCPSTESSDSDEEFEGPKQLEQQETEEANQEEGETENINYGNNDRHNNSEWGPIVGNFRAVKSFNISHVGVIPEVAGLLANGRPIDFFSAIVDDQVISLIVDQTNLYATQVLMKTNVTEFSRLHNWTPTSPAEIRNFLGLVSWMGLVVMPKLCHYWSYNELYAMKFPHSVMTRNRFELLLRFIHFSDNEAPVVSKSHKIQPLIDLLIKKFQSLYVPNEYVCVDETLLPFRGRLSFRQYIKNKRHKYGIKLFKLCSGLGYTFNVKMYTGKENDFLTPEKIVLFLTENHILNEGRTLCVDNWYTSTTLAQKRLEANTHIVGTLRKNRKNIPKTVVNKQLKKGEVYGEEKDGMVVINWKDTRNVLMLTTKHGSEMVEVTSRNRSKLKPKVVEDYNKGKAPVDISDQMGAYSNPLRRSLKWYRKVAFELLLTTSMVNAYILFKLTTGNQISITEFKEMVIKDLVRIQDDVVPESKRRRTVHTLQEKQGEKKHLVRRFCKNCYKKNSATHGRVYATNRTKKCTTFCDDCEGKPHLCLDCFNEIHDNK